ncbi:MAG: GNAT family N-acetyltransferase [Armatimonadota bacterium]
MIYFETQRLVFRDWAEQDLAEFQKMNKDPEVMKYFPKVLSDDETEAFYNRIIDEFKTAGYGLYAVETKHDVRFIGYIGFHKAAFEADFTPCIEIGWRLKREAWGNGYATEGAKACLAYGIPRFGFDRIYSFTAKINLRSENVMKKIEMRKVSEFSHPSLDADNPLSGHVLYMLESPQKY